jgi:hypothetical protein
MGSNTLVIHSNNEGTVTAIRMITGREAEMKGRARAGLGSFVTLHYTALLRLRPCPLISCIALDPNYTHATLSIADACSLVDFVFPLQLIPLSLYVPTRPLCGVFVQFQGASHLTCFVYLLTCVPYVCVYLHHHVDGPIRTVFTLNPQIFPADTQTISWAPSALLAGTVYQLAIPRQIYLVPRPWSHPVLLLHFRFLRSIVRLLVILVLVKWRCFILSCCVNVNGCKSEGEVRQESLVRV